MTVSSVVIHRTVVEATEAVVVAQFANYRHVARAGFYAVVHGELTGWEPAVVVSEDLRPGDRWEFRTSGLWAEQVREAPTSTEQHWSYGLEAFAIRIDNPNELLGRGYGERCALGWELDVFVPLAPSDTEPKQGHGSGVLLYENLEVEVTGKATRWEWSLEPGDVADAKDAGLLTTRIDDRGRTEVVPPTVVIPTLLGEWSVAIADRPASG